MIWNLIYIDSVRTEKGWPSLDRLASVTVLYVMLSIEIKTAWPNVNLGRWQVEMIPVSPLTLLHVLLQFNTGRSKFVKTGSIVCYRERDTALLQTREKTYGIRPVDNQCWFSKCIDRLWTRTYGDKIYMEERRWEYEKLTETMLRDLPLVTKFHFYIRP